MVRFDSKLLLRQLQEHKSSFGTTVATIKYLHEAGAKITLVSSWEATTSSNILASESLSEYLSSLLQLKVVPTQLTTRQNHSTKQESEILLLENLSHFKEERANCKRFAQLLSSGLDLFVNDAFFESHKSLASTVGISRFGFSCIAGFDFEAGLSQLKNIISACKRPYLAIVGGGNLVDKAAALHLLVSICDGVVFVGDMAFQIMNALGLPVPVKLVEYNAIEEALALVKSMKSKGRGIFLPKDFLCINKLDLATFETFSATCLSDGWQPIDLGPDSLEEFTILLSQFQKILWIGPVKFGSSSTDTGGASKLAAILDRLRRQNNLETIVVGKMACKTLPVSYLTYSMIENASLIWDYLKGKNLPGLMALDRAYPCQIQWDEIYGDPTRLLVVDIGSGNGLFLSKMARKRKDLNFLGLEINGKLVNHCLEDISQLGIKNGYFIRTNATSTFRSIVSSYPGQMTMVSIQCPNPDFNKQEDHRWRMLQRSLVEAIVDLLAPGGKALHLISNEFLGFAKAFNLTAEQLVIPATRVMHEAEWLDENPFGVRSDWEQHVLDRGDKMYRLLLIKSADECLKYWELDGKCLG
ncbi:OLC1v1034511C1 [Oldenlandia corymbosa var. corymbosa]|nr:OLC1v1034511C1 [Oldenlandia corymbosa var. corymbosa]